MNAQTEANRKHINKQREQGLVLIRTFIPAEHRERILGECRELRSQHLAQTKKPAA